METRERRARITADIVARTGLDEATIETLVRTFYGKVMQDDLLAPVFDARITDWEPHLQRMCAFWSSVALLTGRYSGQPMAKHQPLPVDAAYFDRWLTLFEETARETCTPAGAEHVVERARMIAQSLEMGIANHHGVLLMKGERYRIPATGGGGTNDTDDDPAGFASPPRFLHEIDPAFGGTAVDPQQAADVAGRSKAEPR